MGRQVKQEAQLNNKQRHTQRTNRLEEKRELVESTKQEEFSVPEESKNFSFHQKEEKVREGRLREPNPTHTPHHAHRLSLLPLFVVLPTALLTPPRPSPCSPPSQGGEVRRTERKWKSLSKQEREAFLQHAHENHEKNDYTKEHMRDMRKEIIQKNAALAQEERQRKVEDAMRITEKKEEKETANRALRDAMYTARYAEPTKAKLMSQPTAEAAQLAGVAQLVAPPPPSPYRIP